MVENRDLFIPLAHDAPNRRFPSEYCRRVCYEKTTVTELPGSKKKLSICSAVSTEYRRVTDGQTSCDGIVLAMHARRAVKWVTRATTVSTGIVIVTTA